MPTRTTRPPGAQARMEVCKQSNDVQTVARHACVSRAAPGNLQGLQIAARSRRAEQRWGAPLGTAARMLLNTNTGWEVLWALLLACVQDRPHEHPAASALDALKSTMCFHPAPFQAGLCTSQGISSASEMILNNEPLRVCLACSITTKDAHNS